MELHTKKRIKKGDNIMDKLKNYLTRNNICFSSCKFGANYFFNAPALSFNGVSVVFAYDGTPEEIRKAHNDLHKIENYCKRYGYIIFNRYGVPGVHYIHIMRLDEKLALNLYETYKKESVSACEKSMHIWHNMGLEYDNEALKGIMEFWGEEYKNALAQKAA